MWARVWLEGTIGATIVVPVGKTTLVLVAMSTKLYEASMSSPNLPPTLECDDCVCDCNKSHCIAFNLVAMAPKMRALAQSQGQERTRSSLKFFEASITIAVGGKDVKLDFLWILEKSYGRSAWQACARLGIDPQTFPAGLWRGILVVNPCWTRNCSGWDVSPSTCHVVYCRCCVMGDYICFWVWLGIVWKITGRNILTLCITMSRLMTWMKAK